MGSKNVTGLLSEVVDKIGKDAYYCILILVDAYPDPDEFVDFVLVATCLQPLCPLSVVQGAFEHDVFSGLRCIAGAG